jgi:tetratricopeptide (TPR) repeat protein
MFRALTAVLAAVLTAAAAVHRQSPSPAAQEANRLFQEQKWEEAARAYEALTQAEPGNGQAWFRRGAALVSLNRHAEAVAPLTKAVEILRGPVAMYTLGSAYAGAGDKDKAFEWLKKAAAGGFAQLGRLQNDASLVALRDDARFKEVSEATERNARPCQYSPEAKQFDFWVGEWDVQVGGQTVGTNVIQRLEDGCIIMENWTGRGGSTGRSMNIYVPLIKKWRQIYMSNGQVVWDMSGEYRDGAMRYEGEILAPNGKRMTRVVFYNLAPDRVRHTQDDSTDGGKTWANVWDSVYVRRRAAAQ